MLPVFDVLGHWNLGFFWVVFLFKIFWLGFGPEAVSATNISQITDLSFWYFLYSSHRTRFFYPFFFPANSTLLSLVTRWQQHWDLVKRMRMSVTPVRSTIKLAHDVFLDSRSEAQRHFRDCWRAHTGLSQRRWMRPFFFFFNSSNIAQCEKSRASNTMQKAPAAVLSDFFKSSLIKSSWASLQYGKKTHAF